METTASPTSLARHEELSQHGEGHAQLECCQVMRRQYTSLLRIKGASLSRIDHIVAITLLYPADNIPAAK